MSRVATPVATPLVEARGLTRRFGALRALDGIDLSLVGGESVAVFGPNGAGKTTLTRILASVLRPTGGTLRVAGLDPRHHEIATRARVGLISHQTLLYDDLTAIENLIFFGRLHGVADPRPRAERLLASLGLASRADDPVRTYSRGMQQRLAVARAILHEPDLVLLDEPFTGLDPHASAVLAATLERLRGEGRTLWITTHDLARGLDLSDRWIILARGRVVAEGVSASGDRAAFEARYFDHVRSSGRPA